MKGTSFERFRTNDYKIATALFRTAFSKQARNMNKEINVAYGWRVTKNNLEDVGLLIDYEIKTLNLDLKYGLVTKKYTDTQLAVLNKLKASLNKTITELYS